MSTPRITLSLTDYQLERLNRYVDRSISKHPIQFLESIPEETNEDIIKENQSLSFALSSSHGFLSEKILPPSSSSKDEEKKRPPCARL